MTLNIKGRKQMKKVYYSVAILALLGCSFTQANADKMTQTGQFYRMSSPPWAYQPPAPFNPSMVDHEQLMLKHREAYTSDWSLNKGRDIWGN